MLHATTIRRMPIPLTEQIKTTLGPTMNSHCQTVFTSMVRGGISTGDRGGVELKPQGLDDLDEGLQFRVSIP